MQRLEVMMSFHDDWLVNVLINDGRVYTFHTELWYQHGISTDEGSANWDSVIEKAKREALFLANLGADTWGLDALPQTEEQFKKAMDLVCRHTSDEDFRTFIRS